MKQEITMGSLFSGSGGFELAGSIFGIRPIWASEIEPFPILVTTKNFPEMKHLGDINKLNGADLEPVTIIAGGSPCQDMSIAGKREGLDGSRSTLFREQIRIIKEMRESDRAAGRTGKQIRPRYMVWENVPGAYSSNKGEDFRCVLEEICQISEGNVSIPRPPKNKWGGQGAIMGDGYSVAWRTLDAQYWGVPQRRKRIYLVADFGGDTAPEILFVREGLSGNFAESREAWQRTAGDIKTGTHKTGAADVECYDISDRRRVADRSEVSPTLTTKMGTGGNNVPIVLENHPQDSRVTIMMIEEYMKLQPVERYAIRWHMGYTEADTLSFNNAIDKYPMIWALHSADTQASHFMEANEGNKLAYAANGSAEYADQPTMQEATAPVFEEATPV